MREKDAGRLRKLKTLSNVTLGGYSAVRGTDVSPPVSFCKTQDGYWKEVDWVFRRKLGQQLPKVEWGVGRLQGDLHLHLRMVHASGEIFIAPSTLSNLDNMGDMVTRGRLSYLNLHIPHVRHLLNVISNCVRSLLLGDYLCSFVRGLHCVRRVNLVLVKPRDELLSSFVPGEIGDNKSTPRLGQWTNQTCRTLLQHIHPLRARLPVHPRPLARNDIREHPRVPIILDTLFHFTKTVKPGKLL
jgi:hypothetical protein